MRKLKKDVDSRHNHLTEDLTMHVKESGFKLCGHATILTFWTLSIDALGKKMNVINLCLS